MRTVLVTGMVFSACAEGSPPGPVGAEAPVASTAQLGCAELTTAALHLWNAEITLSEAVPARSDGTPSENFPAHCLVQGDIDRRTGADGKPYAIGFEVRLPESWNGKLVFQGGGGTDGTLWTALGQMLGTSPAGDNALSNGYAVVTTDGGHRSEPAPLIGGALFGLDPQARVDYGYRALELSLVMAKYIVARHYGPLPTRAYFEGCSNGGRQGLVAAARLGDQFDGILAGAPGFNLPKAAMNAAWDVQQLLRISPAGLGAAFSIADMTVVGRRITERCDALDGAADGMVNDVAACRSRRADPPSSFRA